MSQFNVGDTVRLKSGGPIMTVARLTQVADKEIAGGISVRCQWFVNQDVRESSFHPDTLEPFVENATGASGFIGGRM